MLCPLSHCKLQYLDILHSCCACICSWFANRNHKHNTSDNCKSVTLFVLLLHNFSLILLSLLILLAVKLSRLIMLLILHFFCQIFLGGQFPAAQLTLLAQLSLYFMPTLFSIFIIFCKF